MNIYMVHCDFPAESKSWKSIESLLNSYEGKRHRRDSWFIATEEPISIIYRKLKTLINEEDSVLVVKMTCEYATNYPKNFTNWVDSRLA